MAAEFEPSEYQRLQARSYPARSLRETAEGKYWRRFKAPLVSKQVRAQRASCFAAAADSVHDGHGHACLVHQLQSPRACCGSSTRPGFCNAPEAHCQQHVR